MQCRQSTNWNDRNEYRYRFVGTRKRRASTGSNNGALKSSSNNGCTAANAGNVSSDSVANPSVPNNSLSGDPGSAVASVNGGVRAQTLSCAHCADKRAQDVSARSLQLLTRSKSAAEHKNTSKIEDLWLEDLPKAVGYCCGHAYLDLSNAQICQCGCPQCVELNCVGPLPSKTAISSTSSTANGSAKAGHQLMQRVKMRSLAARRSFLKRPRKTSLTVTSLTNPSLREEESEAAGVLHTDPIISRTKKGRLYTVGGRR